MNCYTLESLAFVTADVHADSWEDALEMMHGYQGAGFEARADHVDADYEPDRIVLLSVSTRLEAIVVDAVDSDGNRLNHPAGPGVPDPEHRTILAPDDAAELAQLVDRLRRDALGDSNDAEIKTAHELADTVAALLPRKDQP